MTHLREIRFSKELGGHSRVKLGIRRQATSPEGEKVRPWLAWGTYLVVELDETELAAYEADRCYVLNVPKPPEKKPKSDLAIISDNATRFVALTAATKGTAVAGKEDPAAEAEEKESPDRQVDPNSLDHTQIEPRSQERLRSRRRPRQGEEPEAEEKEEPDATPTRRSGRRTAIPEEK